MTNSALMRIVFMGTPDFAARILRHVSAWEGGTVVAAYCQPDRPAGRGHKLQAPAVKVLAQSLGIPVCQPERLRGDAARPHLEALAALKPDVLVVAAYGLILPQEVLDIPQIGPFNVHGSLLPRYRGAAPIQRALINGDPSTGITIMRMEAGLDTGPMLIKEALPIHDTDTAASLHDSLAELGGRLMVDVLRQYAEGKPPVAEPQDDANATYAAKLGKIDGYIDWNNDVAAVHARIRGVTPWPGAHTVFLLPDRGPLVVQVQPGQIVSREPGGVPGTLLGLKQGVLLLACGDGVYGLTMLKPAAGKLVSAEAFWNGYCRSKGTVLAVRPDASWS